MRRLGRMTSQFCGGCPDAEYKGKWLLTKERAIDTIMTVSDKRPEVHFHPVQLPGADLE